MNIYFAEGEQLPARRGNLIQAMKADEKNVQKPTRGIATKSRRLFDSLFERILQYSRSKGAEAFEVCSDLLLRGYISRVSRPTA